MAGTYVGMYDTTAANNTATGTNSVSIAEGMAPSNVNNAMRDIMADIRQWYNAAEWIEYGDGAGTYTPAYASGTSFTIASVDVTTPYHVGRRVKAVGSSTGTIYGSITATSFSTNTTVTVSWDSGSLSSETLKIYIGIVSASNTSLPETTSITGDYTLDVSGDIILDADGGDIFFKDGGTTFGSATNTSGNLIIKSGTTTALTFSGANVTLEGTVQIDGAVTVGVDDTGLDVKFFGATAGSYMLWDESADTLVLTDSTPIKLGDGGDMEISHNGTNSLITHTQASGLLALKSDQTKLLKADGGTTLLDAKAGSSGYVRLYQNNQLKLDVNSSGTGVDISDALTVGVDDTGHDVKLFGASAGAYALWDESANLLDLRGATAAGPGHLKLTTGELTVVDADKLGRIDFQAPLESDGTDSILVGASIWAEADDTFSTSVNNTDIVFATGKSETAAEKFRFTADNEIGVAGANYGTDGQVLTSGGAGAAVAWEDASSGAVTQLNNATANELVTIASTTTQLDAEANLTFDGSTLALTGALTVSGDITVTGNDIIFEGATADAYEVTLNGGEPTADHTLTLPVDITGDLIPGKFGGANFTGGILIGHTSTGTLSTANYNLGVGSNTLAALTSGDANVVVGATAGSRIADGGRNTCMGYESGQHITSGDKNIVYGWAAGDNITTGSGNVVIGKADVSSATGDDQLSISDGEDGSVVWMTGDSSANITFAGTAIAAGGQLTTTGKALVLGF